MTSTAERLEVAQLVGEAGRVANRPNVVHLKAAPGATADALETVSSKGGPSDPRPSGAPAKGFAVVGEAPSCSGHSMIPSA